MARANRDARLLDASTSNEVRLLEAHAKIDERKIKIEGDQEIKELKGLIAKGPPAPEEDNLVIPTDWEDLAQADTPIEHLEQRRLNNQRRVVEETVRDMGNHTDVSDDPVDPDVAARILDNAKDVSTHEMQRLWGKLLAGEIAQPGTYSLRTLDVLKNLSSAEARLFERACAACCDDGFLRLPAYRKNLFAFQEYISLVELNRLEDCRLLCTEIGPTSDMHYTVAPGSALHYKYGQKVLALSAPANTSVNLPIISYRLTPAGYQLRRVVERRISEGFLEAFRHAAEVSGFEATIVDISDLPEAELIRFHHAAIERQNS